MKTQVVFKGQKWDAGRDLIMIEERPDSILVAVTDNASHARSTIVLKRKVARRLRDALTEMLAQQGAKP